MRTKERRELSQPVTLARSGSAAMIPTNNLATRSLTRCVVWVTRAAAPDVHEAIAMERQDSAYEDRPVPEPPDVNQPGGEWNGFSGPATGGAAVSPGAHGEVDAPATYEREREGGGAPDER